MNGTRVNHDSYPSAMGDRDLEAAPPSLKEIRNNSKEDALEEYLSQAKPFGLYKHIGNGFLNDYSHLKSDRCYALFQSLFFYQEIGPAESSDCQWVEEKKAYYSDYINNLDSILSKERSAWPQLQICVLANRDPFSETKYGFMTKSVATLRNRFEQLIALPKYGVAFIIEKNWQMAWSNDLLALTDPLKLSSEMSTNEVIFENDAQDIKRELKMSQLFSQKDITHENMAKVETRQAKKYPRPKSKALYKSTTKLHLPSEGMSKSQSCHLDAFEAASFEFHWQSNAPPYQGYFATFLWQPYAMPAHSQYAKVFYQEDGDRKQKRSRRVVVIVESTPVLLKLRYRLETVRPYMSSDTSTPPTHKDTMIIPILAICDTIICDTKIFLKEGLNEVNSMIYSGRKSPSKAKVQYLSHLDDCRIQAISGLQHTASILKQIREENSVIDEHLSKPYLNIINDAQSDMEYLVQELVKLGHEIESRGNMIKTYLDIATNGRVALLTLFASLYIPLSYVNSVLSMQLTPDSFTWGKSKSKPRPTTGVNPTTGSKIASHAIDSRATNTIHDALNETVDFSDLKAMIINATDMITNATDTSSSPNTRIYKSEDWIILSAVLFVTTLLIPVIGPAILRYLVQTIYKNRNHWRICCLIGALLYFAIVYWIVPSIIWYLDAEQLLIWYYNDFPDSFNNLNMVSFVLSAAVMSILCFANIVVSIRSTSEYKKTHIIKWAVFGFVLLVSYLFDAFTDYDYDWLDYDGSGYIASGFAVSTIAPWFYLAAIFAMPTISKLWKKHKERRSKRLNGEKIAA